MRKTKKEKAEATARWRSNLSPEEYKAYSARKAKTMRDRRRTDLVVFMLKNAQRRAKKFGIDCTIKKIDIRIPTHCPVLGIPLRVSDTGRPCDNSPSLDRIDRSKGYVRGNMEVISHRANTLKRDASPAEIHQLWLHYCREYR